MANGSLRGQTLPCPMCSRSIAIPSLTSEEQQGPIELQPLPSNAPTQPYPAYDEFGSPVEYQLAPLGDVSLPLHRIALNSTMDQFEAPLHSSIDELPLVGPTAERTLPPSDKPADVPSRAITPTRSSKTQVKTGEVAETPWQLLVSGFCVAFVAMMVGGLLYFGFDYMEQEHGGETFRAHWIIVLIYTFFGKTGILVAGVLFAILLMTVSALRYSWAQGRRRRG